MKKSILTLSIVAAAVLATGCTRIQTGEVGVRIGVDRQVKQGELLPGSFNQTVIGDVLTFPVKDVSVKVDNLTPLAKDNSTMKDFDAVVIYNINPDRVAELYSSKSKAFHFTSDGDVYLMYNYILQTARNSAYKAAREYEALDMADRRADIETSMKDTMTAALASEGLNNSITITQVLVRQITPADSVVQSANDLVRAKNEFKQKEVEVKTAEAEARRMQALAAQGSQSIAYMDAQARMKQADAQIKLAEAISTFKGNTLVIGASANVNVGK